jgi:hypothetical protein
MMNTRGKAIALAVIALFLAVSDAFSTNPNTQSRCRSARLQHPLTALHASREDTSSATGTIVSIDDCGVGEFESWFRSVDGAWIDDSVQHAIFGGSLRGLAWNKRGGSTTISKTGTKVATIPVAAVLSSDLSQKDTWDSDLALKLWKECQAGGRSAVAGYISLLTAGRTEAVPPSTSPHSLRHWTVDQKVALTTTPAGHALVDLEQRQETAWLKKYESLPSETRSTISWNQFQWAMEAVHSRAFCGVQTAVTTASTVIPLLAPVVAAAVGYAYATTTVFPSEAVLAGLAVAAVLPTLLTLTKQEAATAVLLPVIDSANHLEQADSTIVFDPVKGCFELSIGPACLVQEGDSTTTQLYVSYGKKSDRELILNYGFLPGVPVTLDDDEYRRNLAQAFLERISR